VAYIVGEKEFMGLPLRVTPAVLIPRPETEVLVEAALTSLRQHFPSSSPLHLLDIGTGSGAIALSLAFYRPDARVTALDFSGAALEVAKENARRLGLASRVTFVQADLFPPMPAPGSFHLIISNPPYIPTEELPRLPVDVGAYEPHQALDGGADGLSFYRRLLPPPPGLLAQKGIVALEVGESQAHDVRNLFPGGREAKIIKDYAGLDRVVLFESA
jgi:release factor glutamine methyltransferase